MDVLSFPQKEMIDNELQVPRVERSVVVSVNYSDRFRLGVDRNYEKQYSHIYFVRYGSSRSAIKARCVEKWVDEQCPVVDDILNIKQGQRCIIFGTVYKEMLLKPNILDEYQAREQYEAPAPERSKYNSEEDLIVLEDQTGRVGLVGGGIDVGNLVTGVILGVLGKENIDGDFEVEDVCFLGLGPQKNLLSSLPSSDAFVCITSGLNICATNPNRLALELFGDYLCGNLGGVGDQEIAGNIAHLIIAGNLIGPTSKDFDDIAQYKKRNMVPVTVEHMKDLDMFLSQLASTISIDFMPGENDPSNSIVPQQPLHSSMFPFARKFTGVRGCTNPYEATIDGRQFLGTSGQGVDDVYRYSTEEDRLEILKNTMMWGHLFPTAPDTLGAFPFDSKASGFVDPFYTKECPHVRFVGNQPEFRTDIMKGSDGQLVRLICVPSFSETQTAVVVNLATLDCMPISFKF
eukprot:m.56307 g.56307  ORF g.56307 m.56307 type:complete len:460 (-) comp7794_c0_seq2:140-1519(-)